ncbi:MAG: fibronectin type III domain-containing protein, partial [Desulfobacterales bacterium]|nr:fibronectin type III domain-containing protein [Desulfobacterales bacterium]
YNNTIYQEHAYPNAIEYRWPETTGVLIANNLTNAAISARDNARAELSANETGAAASWFVNASAGDLHLAYEEPLVVDQGQPVSGLVDDFDLDARAGAVDIGADEFEAEAQNAPSAPVLTIDIDGVNVTLSWPPVANADSYLIYYVSFPDGEVAGSFNHPSTSLTVSLYSGVGVCCAVRAQNAVGVSPFSNVEGFILP